MGFVFFPFFLYFSWTKLICSNAKLFRNSAKISAKKLFAIFLFLILQYEAVNGVEKLHYPSACMKYFNLKEERTLVDSVTQWVSMYRNSKRMGTDKNVMKRKWSNFVVFCRNFTHIKRFLLSGHPSLAHFCRRKILGFSRAACVYLLNRKNKHQTTECEYGKWNSLYSLSYTSLAHFSWEKKYKEKKSSNCKKKVHA